MMSDSTWVNDSLTLGGEEVPVKNGYLPVFDLSFYSDNPRIYSFIQRQDDVPSQDEIHRRLNRMDHVKQLIQSIPGQRWTDGPHAGKGRRPCSA